VVPNYLRYAAPTALVQAPQTGMLCAKKVCVAGDSIWKLNALAGMVARRPIRITETGRIVLCDRDASAIDCKHQLFQFLSADSSGRSNLDKSQSQHFAQRSIKPRDRDMQMVRLQPVPERHIQQSVMLVGIEKSSGKIKSLLDRTVDVHFSSARAIAAKTNK
jgi:hypothetical protein